MSNEIPDNYDAQLNLRARRPDFQRFFDRNAALSAQTRDTLACQLDLPYGPHPLQRIDAFPAKNEKAPLVVFIHGGYWRSLDKGDLSFVAEPFVKEGCAVCLPNYRLAPECDIDSIVDDTLASFHWIRNNADAFNGEADRIYLVGHSAGGHLVLMVLLRLFAAQDPALVSIKGTLSVSGLFDLQPVRHSFLNADLKLDAGAVGRNSPLTSEPVRADIPLLFAVGDTETEEFIRQTCAMDARMKALGNPSRLIRLPDIDHFEILYELGADPGRLAKELLALIQA